MIYFISNNAGFREYTVKIIEQTINKRKKIGVHQQTPKVLVT